MEQSVTWGGGGLVSSSAKLRPYSPLWPQVRKLDSLDKLVLIPYAILFQVNGEIE